ncbi:hypothetical protein PPYR_08925 [Photinus pyralis]|uniref:LRRCT domain-containing protein n=2 Tax=Photinus pyralis TaxID=7054 RepID=A0A5N4AKQ5_PHOPY|nr:protein artichoke-like [Photinus pyralis]KAB0797932.1 hypothetical protein PPYR_08925 [Photinus pyralis]
MSISWKWFLYYSLILYLEQGLCQMGQKECPPQEHILPCRCLSRGTFIQIWCSHSNLPRVLEGLRKVGDYIQELIDEVILENNQLPAVPAKTFVPLKVMRLMLRYNGLERVSSSWLSGLETSLVELFIVEPALRSLPEDSLAGLNILEAITINSNLLKRFPTFSDLPKLRYLQIESKSLVELSSRHFRELPTLEKVHITGSPRLSRLEGGLLQDLPKLNLVNISFCGISWIHPRAITHLPALKELWLVGNKIVDPAIVGRSIRDLSNLEVLHLEHNSMETLSEGSFVDLPSLKQLFVSNNRIKELHHGAFHRVPMLQLLDLNKNLIRRVHPESFLQHSGSGLEELWLIENNISHVAELRSLLDALPRLIFLDMSYNSLEVIPFGSLRGHAMLERLHLDHNNLHTIERETFKAMPALRELRLRNNSLSDILEAPFWNLPALKGLDLSHNYFKILQPQLLANLPNLRRLDLSNNRLSLISSEAFLETPALEHINISSNRLSDIHPATFGHLSGLFELDCSYNHLFEFVRGLPPAIEYLHVSKNMITKLPLTDLNLPTLKMMDISYNGIERIFPGTLRYLRQLRKLYVQKNSIGELDEASLVELPNLEVLDLRSNQIEHVEAVAFLHASRLRELNLAENRLGILSDDVFNKVAHMKKLDLSRNQLSEISYTVLRNTKDLQIANVSFNLLSKFPDCIQGMKQLRVLDLTNNKLLNINSTTLKSLSALFELRISKNLIPEIKTNLFGNLPSLKLIYLDNNELVTIESHSFNSLPSLVILKMNNNKLRRLPEFAFYDLPMLQVLELQENQLESISENGFSSITHLLMLNMSHNQFTSLESAGLKNLRSLEMLDMSNNRLSKITNDDFEKMEWLVELRLDNNHICSVQGTPFNEMPRLRILSIKNNKMASFSEKSVRQLRGNLAVLDINGNPLACTCHILWFKAWLEESSILGPKCNDGSLLREMRLSYQDCDRENRQPEVISPECATEFLYNAHLLPPPPYSQENQQRPSPEESDDFYEDFIDYPYNETSLMVNINNETTETSQSSHYISGDTPTIYAASSKNKSKIHPPVTQNVNKITSTAPSNSGFTFFGVPLPSLNLNLNNLWSRGNGRKAEIVKLPSALIAERKSAIVNKVPYTARNFYPPTIPEIESGGFVPLLPGTGGFTPIINPQYVQTKKQYLNETRDMSIETTSEITLSDYVVDDTIKSSSTVINIVSLSSQTPTSTTESVYTKAPVHLSKPTEKTVPSKQIQETQNTTTKAEDKTIQTTQAELGKLVLRNGNEDSTSTASNTDSTPTMNRFEDIFKVFVENVSLPSTYTTITMPVSTALTTKNATTSLTNLITFGELQSHFRPHGRSTITKVQSPRISGTSPLLSDEKITFANAREPKTSRLDGSASLKSISKNKDMSWYYSNYNKTKLEPYIGPAGAVDTKSGSTKQNINQLTLTAYFCLLSNIVSIINT